MTVIKTVNLTKRYGTLVALSNLNLEIGRDVPNLVMTNVSGAGMDRLYNKVGNVQLIADVAGWFET